MGSLSVGLTDAPVDEVYDLSVSITGITAKPQNGEQISFVFDPAREIHLLDLQAGITEMLLIDEPVPAGPYNWIRFDVDEAASTVIDSMGAELPLRVPSERLRFVSGLTVTVNQLTSVIVDWDTRKGLTDPVGQPGMFLRPAFRVIDTTMYAAIGGSVARDLVELDLVANVCSAYDPNTLTGRVVYLYNQMPHDAAFDDIYLDDDTEEGPIATAPVRWNADMTGYEYRIDYVSPGSYTLAYTCQGSSDTSDGREDIEFRSFVDAALLIDDEDQLDRNFE